MTTHKPFSLLSLVLAMAIIFSPHDSFAQDAKGYEVPHIGEMTMFAGSYDISGWLQCDGKLLEPHWSERSGHIFSLLGKRFGGDGIKTFGVTNLTEATKAMRSQVLFND
ncbi:MAG: tail fiber protein [Akkermansiaceae bacterium]